MDDPSTATPEPAMMPSTPASTTSVDDLTVQLLAFDDMEVLDYAGPYEVFNVAGEIAASADEYGSPRFRVHSVATTHAPVVGRGGFTVIADLDLAEANHRHPTPDVLMVPGGAGSRRALQVPAVLDWIRAAAAGPGVVASVCTGALVLAAAGLLAHAEATTHHLAFDELERLSPTTTLRHGQRFVSADGSATGRVWSSGGISAGIDLSLHLVELLAGPALRAEVVKEMEWGWSSGAQPVSAAGFVDVRG